MLSEDLARNSLLFNWFEVFGNHIPLEYILLSFSTPDERNFVFAHKQGSRPGHGNEITHGYFLISPDVQNGHDITGGQILTLSKLDIQQAQGISEDFDMQVLAGDLLDRFAPSIAHKRIRLAAELPQAPLTIHARREEIRTALANLLDNAVKFTPEAGEISLAATKAPGVVKVIVMNTCEPISEEDLKKIFEPFFRIQGEASRGTGLGLAITRKIVERHQGRMNASHRDGKLIMEMSLPEKVL
jgi:signal transduction histidine kinase